MRTTLNIDDDVLAAARALARIRSISLGRAVSDLARRGIEAQRQTHSADGWTVFSALPGDPGFGLEEIRRAEEADDLEMVRGFGHQCSDDALPRSGEAS